MSSKDWLEKDYYKVLGVSKDAKPAEIKKAFHKIARDNHPDQHPGDTKAEQRFKEASEAHSVLSDPKQRKEYDEARSLFGGGGFRMPGGPQNFSDIFAQAGDDGLGDLLGGLFGGGGFAGRRGGGRQARKGRDVEGEVSLGFVDAVEGTSVPMTLRSDAPCATCHGTGARVGTSPHVCTACQGSGMVTSTAGGVFATSEPCRECHGRGLMIDDPCPDCRGNGHAMSTRTITVRIPAGVTDGQRIRIRGKGAAGEHGGPAGDLYVTVHVADDEVFGRKGQSLTLTVPVTVAEAALGAEISVPTLGGESFTLKIPAGTPNGRTLRARGKGARRSDGTRGDLLVTIEVALPPSLSDEARAALESFAKATADFDPRAHLEA